MSKLDDISRSPSETLTSEEAFELVGNDIRAEILRVLSQARGGEGSVPALSFSELRSRVAPDIDSSQFNYHLQQLVGQFIERSEDESAQLNEQMAGEVKEGYRLRPEGTILTRTIRAGVSASHTSFQPFDIGLDCYYCNTPVEAAYGNALFIVQCPDCDHIYEYELIPPGGLADETTVMVDQISEYLRHRRLSFARGSCPLCANGLGVTFLGSEDMRYPRSDRREAVVNRWCDHCGERDYLRIGEVLLRDPALITFCRNHSVNVTTVPLWDLEFVATDRYVSVHSTDPWEVGFRLPMGDSTLELRLNERLDVTQA